MKYTYDDIVTAKDILTGKVKKDDIIGKKGWLLDCIPRDMSLNVIARLGVHVCLMEINLDNTAPFGDGGIPFIYFLPEKEKKEESAAGPAISGTETGRIGKESYEMRQYNWLKANDIGEGDKVRIARKAEDYDGGWNNNWAKSMDGEVGKVGFVVEDNGDRGIVIDTENGHWSYPYFVLEKVEEESLFKDGDRVRIVKEWCGFNKDRFEPTVGKTGRILFVSGHFARVALDSARDWVYEIDALEPIEDEPETKESAPKKRTRLEDIAYRLWECMHSRYVAFFEEDDYLMVSGFANKPCFSEEDGIWYPSGSERGSMYDLSIPDAAYSDCPEEWKVGGKVDFSKAIIDMEADDRPAASKRAEDEPAYIPFNLSDPKDRDVLRGKWIKDKRWGNKWMISGFYIDETGGQGWKAKLTRKNVGFTGQELMERFTFLYGSPIGKKSDNQ